MAGGSRRLTARRKLGSGMGFSMLNAATCANACTPASVRPLPATCTGWPSMAERISSSRPCMVGRPGCTCLVTEKDPEALKVVRPSAAHVLATAVLELFPETKLGHGPATDSGFFYDFYREKPFTPDDLALIEKKMAEVIARDERFVHEFAPRDKSLEDFERDGDFMKTHFVTKFTEPGSDVSFYRNGKFIDFCRGPHVPSTGRVKAVKVTTLAGAYWLGDEKNPQLQRIYGTAFFSQKDLDAHFARLEEAAKRDHRLLGKQLDLFSI